MPAQQHGIHAASAASGPTQASSKSLSRSRSPSTKNAAEGSPVAAVKGKGRMMDVMSDETKERQSPRAAGRQRVAPEEDDVPASVSPRSPKRVARSSSKSPKGGASPHPASPTQLSTRAEASKRSDSMAALSPTGSEAVRRAINPRSAMAALTESPPSPSPSPILFSRGELSGSPAARPNSSISAVAANPSALDLASIAARKGDSPRGSITLSTTGLANHAPSPMSPIPDRPLSAAGTFSSMDLGMSGIDSAVVGRDAGTLVSMTPSEVPSALTLSSLPTPTDDVRGSAMVDADSSSGEISFEQRPASTGDISAGSSSTGEISLTDMTIPEHEHLSPAATISRGLYHQCGTARRVKVYELQNDNWFDHGTGYCAGVYDEEHDQALLVAKSEELCQYMSLPPPPAEDENREPGGIPRAEEEDLTSQYIIVVSAQLSPEEVLLCTQVVREDIYQRQQDTLIVWTEPGGKDMALSFQEAEGCNEIWEFLSEVQKHFKINGADDGDSSEPGQPMSRELGFEESFQTGEEMLSMVEGDHILPEPTLGNVEQIDFAVRELASRPPQFRERFAEWLLKTGYIKSMIELFHDAEDLEQLGVLHSLCSIMQNLLLLNDTVMFEWILQDNVFLGVVGMLEYDPVFPRDKASFRQYLSDPGRFRQVVPITDANILTKIHHTYRLHYLKDVILARILEDATFSTLQSILFFYQVDIVSYCGGNEDFLRRLFAVFKTSAQRGDAAAEQHKRDGVIFLQQLCNMGKTIQLHSRISLYHTLVEWGLIDVIEFAFDAGDATLRNAAAEMLIVIIEYDANSVRLRILELKDKKERTLMAILIEHLHRDGDMGLKSQIVEILRTLLDCGDGSNTTASQAMMQQQVLGNKQGPKADPERFLTAFYEEDCELLLAPLKQLPDVMTLPRRSRLPPMSLSRSALFGHLCDLLCFISTCHGFRSQYFVITSEVSKKVATLLRSRDKHVRCASLRFFKACLANNNQFINRHHIKIELFETLLDIVEEEADRDNLVTSACISYFEYMKQEAVMKPLINHIAEKNQPALQRLARHSTAGKVFSELLSRWEQSSSSLASSKALIQTNEDARRVPPKRRGATTKAMEAEAEESYFHDDQEPEASGSEAKVITPVPNLVPYADDDFDFDVTPSSTPSQNSGSSSTPDAQGSASVAETSIEDAPMLRLGEKRRREEDEDALDMLSAKRKQAPPSTDASADAEPQAKRQNQDGSSPAASTILGDTEGGFIREEAQEVLALLPSQAAGPIPVSSEPSLSPRVPGPASSNTKKVSLALSQSAIKMAQDSSTGDGEKGRKEAARDGSGS